MTERRFKAATRPLNRRERRERMLDLFEDSLYRAPHQHTKKRARKTKPALDDNAISGDAEAHKQRRHARRTTALAHARQQ